MSFFFLIFFTAFYFNTYSNELILDTIEENSFEKIKSFRNMSFSPKTSFKIDLSGSINKKLNQNFQSFFLAELVIKSDHENFDILGQMNIKFKKYDDIHEPITKKNHIVIPLKNISKMEINFNLIQSNLHSIYLRNIKIIEVNSHKKTEKFLKNFHYLNYSKKSLFDIDYFKVNRDRIINKNYKFHLYSDKIYKTTVDLLGIKREKVLKTIMSQLNIFEYNKKNHLKVLRFIENSLNPQINPRFSNNTGVFDPLILLELGESSCGNSVRLFLDLFATLDLVGRVILTGKHETGEIYHKGRWHIVEPHSFAENHKLYSNTTIPSFKEICKNPKIFDEYPIQIIISKKPHTDFYWGSEYLCHKGIKRQVTKNKNSNLSDKYYGWLSAKVEEFFIIENKKNVSTLVPPTVSKIFIKNGKLNIGWDHSDNMLNNFKNYRVCLSKKSRGWNYFDYTGKKEFQKNWSKFHTKNNQLLLNYIELEDFSKCFDTRINKLIIDDFELPFFINFFTIDTYGVKISRKLFKPSNEFFFKKDNIKHIN